MCSPVQRFCHPCLFQSYLDTNVFDIPSNVLLPEDEVQATSAGTVEESQKLDQEIKDCQDKILAVCRSLGMVYCVAWEA